MDKTTFVRARVSEKLKGDFDDICSALGKQPTVQLRQLVEEFVRREQHRLNDRVLVEVFKPEDYNFGAWRVTIKLRDPSSMLWSGEPIPFQLPELPHRNIMSDREYQAVIMISNADWRMGGKFVGGEWRGNLYTNGCPEEDNPTSIETVEAALLETITALLDRSRSRQAITSACLPKGSARPAPSRTTGSHLGHAGVAK